MLSIVERKNAKNRFWKYFRTNEWTCFFCYCLTSEQVFGWPNKPTLVSSTEIIYSSLFLNFDSICCCCYCNFTFWNELKLQLGVHICNRCHRFWKIYILLFQKCISIFIKKKCADNRIISTIMSKSKAKEKEKIFLAIRQLLMYVVVTFNTRCRCRCVWQKCSQILSEASWYILCQIDHLLIVSVCIVVVYGLYLNKIKREKKI